MSPAHLLAAITENLSAPDRGALVELAWQATAVLLLGLGASLLLRRRPARAHHALVLALAATLAVPAFSHAVRTLGWGWLPGPVIASSPRVAESLPAPDAPADVGGLPATASRPADAIEPRTSEPAVAAASPTPRAEAATAAITAERRVPFAALAWLALSSLALVRLARAWRRGRRLVAGAAAIESGELRVALARAVASLGLSTEPRLATCAAIRCPMLWPWGRRPVILVPADAQGARSGARPVDWSAVFTHELAHWQRGDHRSQLLAQLVLCALPWHPLVWLSVARLRQTAESACDDWVLAGGHSRADYADSLLAFAPERGQALGLAAVGGRSTLGRRVVRILQGAAVRPRVGALWRGAALAAALMFVTAIAGAQPGPARLAAPQDAAAPQPAAPGAGNTVSGVVVDDAGRPLEGIEVHASFYEPIDDVKQVAVTDAGGRFTFADLQPRQIWSFWVDDARFARGWPRQASVMVPSKDSARELELVLEPPRRLSGVVVDEAGAPVPGARVTVVREFLEDPRYPVQGHNDQDLATATTDATGGFAFERLRRGWVSLMVDRVGYARTFSPGDPRIATGSDDARLVLERGLSIEGRALLGGRPLADVPLTVQASNLSHRPIGEWQVRTDSDGRFRIDGLSTLFSRGTLLPVSLQTSRPAPLATISVDTPELASPRYAVFDTGEPLPEFTIDAQPRAALPEPPTVEVNRPTSGQLAHLAGEPVGDAGVGTLEVRLDAPAEALGKDAREVSIRRLGDDLAVERRAEFPAAGTATFDRLPAGRYRVAVQNWDTPMFPAVEVEVRAGELVHHAIAKGIARIHGTLRSGGALLDRGAVLCKARRTDPPGIFGGGYGIVAADGTWEIDGVPLGHYQLIFGSIPNDSMGNWVPNYREVEVLTEDTVVDLELPSTRIDVALRGRDMLPADFEQQVERGTEVVYSVQAYPSGNAPMGGNTCGYLNATPGGMTFEHLPPGSWTLRTHGAGSDGYLAARVELPAEDSHVLAVLEPTNGGSASVSGQILGWDLVPRTISSGISKRSRTERVMFYVYPTGPQGIDVTVPYGTPRIEEDGRFTITGLPAGHWGILLQDEAYAADGEGAPYLYLPDVVLADGEAAVHDFIVPPSRAVLFTTETADGLHHDVVWWIDLGGGDFIPFSQIVGSSPTADVAIPRPFTLAVGDHPLRVAIDGGPPVDRVIHVEAGEGVQEIPIVQ